MKHLTILFTLIWFSTTVFGQFPKDEETGKVVYTDVIELKDLNKEAVYEKAKLWVVSTLKSDDNMVELDAEGRSRIIGTGNILIDSLQVRHNDNNLNFPSASLNFKFSVFCKDGKVKYVVENFLLGYLDPGINSYRESGLESILLPRQVREKHAEKWASITEAYLDRKISEVINSFDRAMKAEKNNDW